MRRASAYPLLALVVGGSLGPSTARAADHGWPTPNRAFLEGRPYEDFVQPTESGLTISGLFGCVRTGGRQFHEGLDLLALNRGRDGEALDDIYSISRGVVRYINKHSGRSDYGRYVVIEHVDEALAVISLYAHLASIDRAISEDAVLDPGHVLGVMGRSAATYTIPKSRAHLHLEVGLWLSTEFQTWYDAQRYSTRNRHGVYNGYNIVALDYLDFRERQRGGEVRNLLEYVTRLPVAVSVVVPGSAVPDFVERYPQLVAGDLRLDDLAGWQIDFTWFGLPKLWRPLDAAQLAGARGSGETIVFHDEDLLSRFPCQSVVELRGGRPLPGSKLRQILAILFSGVR